MANNTQLNQNTTPGDEIATLDVGGIKHEQVINEFLIGGVPTMVDSANPLPVTDANQQTDALTNVELRASPVPISGTVTANTGLTQPLTDVQLRATPVPVSGTVTATVDTSLLATSAKQDTQITAEQAILAKIIAAPATEAKQTQPGVDIGDVTINNATGAAAVNIQDGGNSITVDNNGTFVTQSTLAAETTKVIGTVNISAAQTIAAVTAITNALPAGNNNIGDVDIATIPALVAGSALIGKVGIDQTTPGTTNAVAVQIQTANGWSTNHLVSAATTNATVVKASAGQVGGWYIYNSNASARKVAFHNTASTPTAGTGVVASLVIPGLSAANVLAGGVGIQFTTGIAFTTVTGLADNDTAAVAVNDLIINLFYN